MRLTDGTAGRQWYHHPCSSARQRWPWPLPQSWTVFLNQGTLLSILSGDNSCETCASPSGWQSAFLHEVWNSRGLETLVKIMFWCSNILYVWIDDIAANLFKFSAGVQQDCKMLQTVKCFIAVPYNSSYYKYGTYMGSGWKKYGPIMHKSTIVLCSCYWNVFLQPTVSIV